MKIISQAPCRISFIGGGTDLDSYATKFGGAVISMAINIRQKFTLLDGKDQFTLRSHSEVPEGCTPDFIYAFRERFGVNSMHHNIFISETDGGIRGGIGSSAAIAVAIVGALTKAQNKTISRSEIAELAWEIETKDLKMYGGKQDQYAAAFGGLNLFEFTNKVNVQTFDRKYVESLMPALVLINTNLERTSKIIQEGLKKLTKDQILALNQIKQLVIPTVEAIGQGDWQTLGEILDTAWEFKKLSNKVSNERIDNIYKQAKELGAVGGKLCGSGGGGFMLFVVDPAKRELFIKEMELYKFKHIDFSPDYNGVETRIL